VRGVTTLPNSTATVLEPGFEVPEDKYRNNLIDTWKDIGDIWELFLKNYLANQPDIDVINEFIAKTLRLWLELLPKARSQTKIKEDFNSFEASYDNPASFLSSPEEILRLFRVLRETLEVLDITSFEQEANN